VVPALAAAFLALVLGTPGQAAPGQDGAAATSEEEVRRRATQVAEISGKQAGVLDRIELSRQKVRFSESVLKRATEQKGAFQRAIADGRKRLGELERQESAAREYLASRMRQRYALGILQEYRVVFAASGTQDMKDASIYLAALAREDQRQIRMCQETREQIAQARRSMEERQANLDQVEAKAREERALLQEEISALSDLMDEVNTERAAAQKALDETLSASRKLDRYVEDLSVKKRVDMATKNMADARGRLPYPARGRVVAGFGDTVHPKFKTRIPHPGLDLAVAAGAPVKAVFDGEVSFAGWLSGYGYTVVLSHPGGYFTVYAYLDQLMARPGDGVSQGDTLATAGSGAGTDRPLYFELRQGGQAVNPIPWLRSEDRGSRKGKKR
jgi:septal ring factor EnvC (AmiA/AmiB activator)